MMPILYPAPALDGTMCTASNYGDMTASPAGTRWEDARFSTPSWSAAASAIA